MECSFACQFPECFSNFAPSHGDAFVSVLPGNKQKGRAQSGSEQCPGTSLAESLPNRVGARLLLLSGPSAACRAGRSVLFIGVWREQAPDHGNGVALGHRPYASDSAESLMVFLCHVPTISPFNPALAGPHHELGIINVAGRWQEKSRISFPLGH